MSLHARLAGASADPPSRWHCCALYAGGGRVPQISTYIFFCLWHARACAASVPVTLVSSVVNDTPLVAMMIPIVLKWANKNAMPPSWFLLPLSYSALLGGVITIIGSSTNLVLADLMRKDSAQGGDSDFQLSFFSTTIVALPVALIAGALSRSPAPSRAHAHTRTRGVGSGCICFFGDEKWSTGS